MEKEKQTIVIGIDEAGYGPLLGPLVVSASAYRVPARHAEGCLWETLHRSIDRNASRRSSRISIADSKKLYHRKQGLARLERGVLSALTAWRDMPDSLHGLISLLCPELLHQIGIYPWYRSTDPALPRSADLGGILIGASLLRRDMAAQSICPIGCWSEVLLEGHYNDLVNKTNNKAVVLLGLVLRLIQRVADAHPEHDLRILVDKQGGRQHYAHSLLMAFQQRRLKVLAEDSESSEYEMVLGPSKWLFQFCQGGESKHLPVALASMISKYVRELLMERFNAFWAAQAPEVKPTAGYYQDGQRFLRDIQPHLRRLGIKQQQMVRQR